MRSVKNFIDGIWIEIYDKAVKDEEASEKAGTPIYKNVPHMKKKAPNSRDWTDQPLTDSRRIPPEHLKDEEARKYRELVSAFDNDEEVPLDGTPLEQWPGIEASQIATLKSVGVVTVQALADLSEAGLHRLPTGYMSLKNKAKSWLEKTQGNEALKAENDKLKSQLETMQEQIAELQANQKKKPGRPPKQESEAA